MGTSITLLREWASAGSRTTPSYAKIDQGWLVGEEPAAEWENERMNVRDATVNEVITYLNAGVPVSDLISGTVELTASQIDFIGSSDIVSIDENRVRVSGASAGNPAEPLVTLEKEGLGFDPEVNCDTDQHYMVGVSLENGTWTQSGDRWYMPGNIDIADMTYSEANALYTGAMVVGAFNSRTYAFAVSEIHFQSITGGTRIDIIYIEPSLDPNLLTTPRLCFLKGRYLSLVPSGL